MDDVVNKIFLIIVHRIQVGEIKEVLRLGRRKW